VSVKDVCENVRTIGWQIAATIHPMRRLFVNRRSCHFHRYGAGGSGPLLGLFRRAAVVAPL